MSAPTHNLVLTKKDDANGKCYSTVGVAWVRPDGRASIQLNDGVVLDWRMAETHWINLYPRNDRDRRPEASPPRDRTYNNDDFEPVPF